MLIWALKPNFPLPYMYNFLSFLITQPPLLLILLHLRFLLPASTKPAAPSSQIFTSSFHSTVTRLLLLLPSFQSNCVSLWIPHCLVASSVLLTSPARFSSFHAANVPNDGERSSATITTLFSGGIFGDDVLETDMKDQIQTLVSRCYLFSLLFFHFVLFHMRGCFGVMGFRLNNQLT